MNDKTYNIYSKNKCSSIHATNFRNAQEHITVPVIFHKIKLFQEEADNMIAPKDGQQAHSGGKNSENVDQDPVKPAASAPKFGWIKGVLVDS